MKIICRKAYQWLADGIGTKLLVLELLFLSALYAFRGIVLPPDDVGLFMYWF